MNPKKPLFFIKIPESPIPHLNLTCRRYNRCFTSKLNNKKMLLESKAILKPLVLFFFFSSFLTLDLGSGLAPSLAVLSPFFSPKKLDAVCDCACDRRWSFNIFPIQTILWSLMKTREWDFLVMGVGNQYSVPATVV